MIKIVMTCRNRLEVTKKAIEILYKHTTEKFQLYVFDNISTYKTKEHFEYFWKMYDKKLISQITFNTEDSTFNAFSKATSLNSFGLNHEQDPNKNDYDFLTIIDSDIIVSPGWDVIVKKAWDYINSHNMDNIQIVSQIPGGIKKANILPDLLDNKYRIITGIMGGSGFWNIRPNFFKKVGYLNIKELIGLNKRHDQKYWGLLKRASLGKHYIVGIGTKLCYHAGAMAGSSCNVLSNKTIKMENRLKHIEFQENEEQIKQMTTDNFYNLVSTKYIDW